MAWTLVHFLWQGTLIAALVAALLRLTARSEAKVRHGVCLAGLVALALLPVVTYWTIFTSQQASTSQPSGPFQIGDMLQSSEPLAPWMPWACAAWILGVGAFQCRACVQLLRARTISRRGVEPAPPWLTEMVEQLCRRLDLSRTITVVRSSLATVPAVVGWLSPVVLIPLGALDTLPPEQLRAVLAHELAHVRRHDYLINLFQLLLESALFFHPAVWWIGAKLREEREYCCDDVAVAACGNALTFARALSTLDALRKPAPMAPASAASLSSQGGSLLKRITRLVDQTPRRQSGLLASTTLAALMFCTVAASGAVTALCDDVCLAENVIIRDGLTVIDSAGHDADCTLIVSKGANGRMRVNCVDHVQSEAKIHPGHDVQKIVARVRLHDDSADHPAATQLHREYKELIEVCDLFGELELKDGVEEVQILELKDGRTIYEVRGKVVEGSQSIDIELEDIVEGAQVFELKDGRTIYEVRGEVVEALESIELELEDIVEGVQVFELKDGHTIYELREDIVEGSASIDIELEEVVESAVEEDTWVVVRTSRSDNDTEERYEVLRESNRILPARVRVEPTVAEGKAGAWRVIGRAYEHEDEFPAHPEHRPASEPVLRRYETLKVRPAPPAQPNFPRGGSAPPHPAHKQRFPEQSWRGVHEPHIAAPTQLHRPHVGSIAVDLRLSPRAQAPAAPRAIHIKAGDLPLAPLVLRSEWL
ncbi:MAG: beta-lactamase regulating signal transducer with metallopeptidase domain [Pseudohongiellaceae bacterium]|jgi:beta-lactamase regulating signal transducer with metallopeptidase domain